MLNCLKGIKASTVRRYDPYRWFEHQNLRDERAEVLNLPCVSEGIVVVARG
jgi:hypothetical protein